MADDSSLVVGMLQQTRLLSYGQPYPGTSAVLGLKFTPTTHTIFLGVNHTVIKTKSREFLSPGRAGGGLREYYCTSQRQEYTQARPKGLKKQKIMLNINNINIILCSLKLKSWYVAKSSKHRGDPPSSLL